MLTSDVIESVREFLGDQDKHRYTDEYLINLLNEGLLDLSKELRLFKSEVSIPFNSGQSVYSLPIDFIEFEDISLNGETPIGFASMTDVARLGGPNWRRATIDGPPTNLVYDKQSFYQFRMYPVPTGTSIYELYTTDDYGFPTEITGVEVVDVFGIFPSLEDELHAVLFDPNRISQDLDDLGNQVNFLAQQISQYSSVITANTVAIQQVHGIAASAQTGSAAAQATASAAALETTNLKIRLDNIANTGQSIESVITHLLTLESQITVTNTRIDDLTGVVTAIEATADAALTVANSVETRIDDIAGSGTSLESLASNVTSLAAEVELVEQTAAAAIEEAGQAQVTAGSAVSTANSALTVANNVTARIDNISGSGTSIESLASNVTAISASVAGAVGTAQAALNTANSVEARIDNIGGTGTSIESLASSQTTLSATVDSNSAEIDVLAAVVADLEGATAKWQVSTTVNGLSNGFGIWNDGGTERVVFRTSTFRVYPTVGNTGVLTFAVEGGKVVIPNASITNIIQSDNYVANVSGWAINKNGGAEFRSIVARGDIQASSLNAATGTFSGTLTAAAVNAVNTINLADQSVVIDGSYINANSQAFNASFVTVGNKSITMASANVNSTIVVRAIIHVVCTFNVMAESVVGYREFSHTTRILRDGIVLSTQNIIQTKQANYFTGAWPDVGNYSELITHEFVDAPNAGTFNYQVQIAGAVTNRPADGSSNLGSLNQRYAARVTFIVSGGKR